MNEKWSRRRVLKQLAAMSATLALPTEKLVGKPLEKAAFRDLEVQISTVSAHTVRLTVLPVTDGKAARVPFSGALVRESWGTPAATLRGRQLRQEIQSGNLRV